MRKVSNSSGIHARERKELTRNMKRLLLLVIFFVCVLATSAQHTTSYDLAKMFRENKLVAQPGRELKLLNEKDGVSTNGIVWLKDIDFNEGTIDIDLRGKNVFLKSFLGIAFHAVDTNTYETVFFRPFNFRHEDTLRKKWSVQYMCAPNYSFDTLRKAHPFIYENAVTPVPEPDDWFHATIVIKDDQISVYVNHSPQASLKTKKLDHLTNGKIGLWGYETLNGDFANLSITQ
ncbi:MAG TPA: hypothetical protein VK787_06140 [Puia sp.]|jgi:hypothetical protein|nr:hypothetical protein [Puia sp.]